MMEDYAEQNKSMTFSYFDYQLSRQTIVANDSDATKDQAKSNIRQLGGAGRLVTRAFAALQSPNTLGGESNDDRALLNKYNAFAPSRTDDVNGTMGFSPPICSTMNASCTHRTSPIQRANFTTYRTPSKRYHTPQGTYIRMKVRGL